MKKKNYYNLILPAALIGLIVIFITQNLTIIEVNFLFFEGHIRLINLVLICVLIGAISAWSLSFYRHNRKKKKTVDADVIEEKPSQE